ncbi:MAG: YgiT-type zinc finger protein, partial [Saprospiraceae bacterium]|nr:YgiT-type zinc finger protein [Saprospiraceae bacterium]
MNCTICKISETKSGKTTILLERGESIIIIKDVPAH